MFDNKKGFMGFRMFSIFKHPRIYVSIHIQYIEDLLSYLNPNLNTNALLKYMFLIRSFDRVHKYNPITKLSSQNLHKYLSDLHNPFNISKSLNANESK